VAAEWNRMFKQLPQAALNHALNARKSRPLSLRISTGDTDTNRRGQKVMSKGARTRPAAPHATLHATMMHAM